MEVARLAQLRLRRFKAFKSQRLAVAPLTMLIGRNGGGKSNALDALSLLALLASDRTLADLDRDDPKVSGLRGGLGGCAPFGHGTIEIGATIDLDDEMAAVIDIEIDPERFEVVRERLLLRGNRDLTLIEAARNEPGGGLVTANTYSGGPSRTFSMPANRMVTLQTAARIPGDIDSQGLVVDVARRVIGVLSGILVLDPTPSSMRHYVRVGSPADRMGSSLSSQLHALQSDSRIWARLLDLVRGLVGDSATDLTFAEGRFPSARSPVDVMVALREVGSEGEFLTPASAMSDGTLRYLTILSTLLSIRRAEARAPGAAPRTVVVEEIENGLFPDQASRILSLLREEAGNQSVTLVTTTHSPALLDAVRPEDHEGIVIVHRDEDALSRLIPLIEHEKIGRAHV